MSSPERAVKPKVPAAVRRDVILLHRHAVPWITIAHEYRLTYEQVESIIRDAMRTRRKK